MARKSTRVFDPKTISAMKRGYETWDGDDIFRCYLTTMDDLMALETKSLDLSHSLLDLDNLEQ